ncbi:hypothetical protein SAMN05444414_1016 [Roseovarius marisflavi]|uniref:Uncharacterized protein n=1 Tax=Roseovarius marisflavi TaxID=1054996 RepID=A0A1M6UZL4_9RHOB|nr:hypothetical protein SAMN05444414_1016 [Roseovarius marisflavi]
MDAVEDIGEVSLRVEAVQLGRFDDNHGTRKCFRPSISAREEPVFSFYSNRAQGPLGWKIFS